MKREELQRIARDTLNRHYYGSLSTVDEEGYAYGSLVRFCVDETGQPVFCLSRIAQHTANFTENPKVSLFLLEGNEDNIQESPRLTVYGHMQRLEPEAGLVGHVSRFFPETQQYHEELDFDFYRLNVDKARFVGGFANAHWLDNSFLQPNPLELQERAGIVGHMNEDHSDALAVYCKNEGIDPAGQEPVMAGIDREGCHIRLGSRVVRIPFSRPVTDRVSAREVLVEMVSV